ncbi:MAG: PAS domain-containing sensor histidine kinase [Alphaproteobacteria bacterium]|nr:PAS domain-containing sensor histidine kinase [Alphaproteobacteria bacterium]
MATSLIDRPVLKPAAPTAPELAGLFAHTWTLAVNVVNAAIIVSILWGLLPPSLLIGWLATMTALVAMRIAFARSHARDPGALSPAQWASWHSLGSGITGLAWGATGIVPLVVADPVMHVLVAITAAGMGAGALILSFTHLPSFRAFVLGHSLPVVLGLALHGGTTYLGIAAMGLVFTAVLDRIGCRLNLAHRETQALQARLVESEQRMRDFAEAASHWLWETDRRNRFTTVSEGVTRVTGLVPAAFIGHTPTEMSSTDPERQRISSEIESRMAAREAFMDLPMTVRLPDGHTLALMISARPVFGDDGGFVGYRGTTRDVTAQRAAERAAEEMRRARDVAAAADELKTRFLASVSHELRTPLNAVIGFSEMMAKEMLGPIGSPTYRSYAANIRDSGRHLLDLINDLLDMSRIELGHYRPADAPVDLREVVRLCVEMVRATIPDGAVTIDDAATAGAPAIRADPRALRQALLNLLSNAVRAAPQGSAVVLSVTHAAGGALEITVTDAGPGIPAGSREALFQPFGGADPERTRRHGGTGLGLSISRSLIEAMGGSLTLDDAPGHRGTRATMRLPAERVIVAAQAADGAGD